MAPEYHIVGVIFRIADGERRRYIYRRLGERKLARNPQAAVAECQYLRIARAAGAPGPEVVYDDSTGFVMEFIAGEPNYSLDLGAEYARLAPERLVAIHAAGLQVQAHAILPSRAEQVAHLLASPPSQPDEDLQESRIRAILSGGARWLRANSECLLHGDFWPGNLLWHDGRIVGVVDWEDAARGDPLADLAVSRLDVRWIFGRDGMETFTADYRSLMELNYSALPYWDLWAALRPAGQLGIWAAGWPGLGRPDITETSMRAAHAGFVRQAIDAIDREPISFPGRSNP